ncbi:glycosyltransferase family 2 protein [Salinispora pacifica]|uniref:glycosyltransferase family 2 protein n=1 Tax=Salinispora pacifica TaxID=351187 RepID=UPI0004865B23|nr:glycosyltransferase family 2 protein [Salinispora pacifica]
MTIPPLIAVIGPVEPDLLTAFVRHYRAHGVHRFLLAFHFPDDTSDNERVQLLDTCGSLGISPALVNVGPWHEYTNTHLRDELRGLAGPGWHLLADTDEFHTYPNGLIDTLHEAASAGTGTVGGLMLDRIATDGQLRPWTPQQGLDRTYPLGGFLTHYLLRGDPRKIVLAHSTVPVSSGNHRAPGRRPANRPSVVVHHFKWRHGVDAYLQQRVTHLADGSWRSSSTALLRESRKLLDHLARHDGRIAVDSPTLRMRPVTINALPAWWAQEAAHIIDAWRPPPQNEPTDTISSPSPSGRSNRA